MFEVYTKDNCVYCDRAKDLLTKKGREFKTYKIGEDIKREDVLDMFPNIRTVPIIVKDGVLMGGYIQLEQHLAGE